MENIAFDYLPPATNTEMAQQRPRQQQGSACDECRRRKLRCDRRKPQCLACANSGIACITNNEISTRGPKKGHVNVLKNKIATLEARLREYEKGQSDKSDDKSDGCRDAETDEQSSVGGDNSMFSTDPARVISSSSAWLIPVNTDQLLPTPPNLTDGVEDLCSSLMFQSPDRLPMAALLTPLVCSDLDKLYFDRVHVFAPLLQKARYLSWSKQMDKPKQKICLQYAMWTMTACLSSQFHMIRHELYTEARRLLDTFDTENHDNFATSIEQPQAWLLLSIYEMISDQFQRGLVSAGRAFRLIQLMGLYEVDKQLPVGFQGDWVDKEAMRRTFWVAYSLDRFTSVVDGLPLTFDEREIGTLLPAPDSHFMSGQPIAMCFLYEVISGINTRQSTSTLSGVEISPFAESAIMATICGRVFNLRRQLAAEYGSQSLTKGFYQQHQSVNSLLVARLQTLSIQLSSSQGNTDSMLIFLAISAYMAVFMLCETLESLQLSPGSSEAAIASSKQQSLEGAGELGMLISKLSQLNHFETHPFTPIPLLIGAKFCRSHVRLDDDYTVLMPLITSALQGLGNVNGLARNFLRLLNHQLPGAY